MLPWRASGVHLRTSLFTTAGTRQGNKPFERSPNTSRSFTIGRDGRNGWDTYLRRSTSGSSMQARSLHENISCPLLTSGVRVCFHLTISFWLLKVNWGRLAGDFQFSGATLSPNVRIQLFTLIHSSIQTEKKYGSIHFFQSALTLVHRGFPILTS